MIKSQVKRANMTIANNYLDIKAKNDSGEMSDAEFMKRRAELHSAFEKNNEEVGNTSAGFVPMGYFINIAREERGLV